MNEDQFNLFAEALPNAVLVPLPVVNRAEVARMLTAVSEEACARLHGADPTTCAFLARVVIAAEYARVALGVREP